MALRARNVHRQGDIERDGEICSVGIGRFGPYVRLGSTYASLTPEDDPLEIDLQRAVELIAASAFASPARARAIKSSTVKFAVSVSRGRGSDTS